MNHVDTKGQIYNSLSGVKKKNCICFKTCANDWITNFRSGLRKLKICLKRNCSLQQHFQFLYQWVLALCGSLFCSFLYGTKKEFLLIFFFSLLFLIYLHLLYLFSFPHPHPMLELPHSKIGEWQQVWQPLGWWRIWQQQASPACSSG